MAIELNNRIKILAGVAVLVAAGAGAWFFFLDDFLNEPPPKAVAAKAAPKPAADAAKSAPDAAKPAAEAAKAAAAPAKPAAAKPIPTDPDKLIAEVIETSGLKAQMEAFGRELSLNATIMHPALARQLGQENPSAADVKAVIDTSARIFDADKMTPEIAVRLKAAFNAERMTRFLEILRQPLALKMGAQETRQTYAEEMQKMAERTRKEPPTKARLKVILALDEITQNSEVGVQLTTLAARELMDAVFTGMQKAGKQVPKDARQIAGSNIVAAQDDMRNSFHGLLYRTHLDGSVEELAEYVKLLDTDTGRWGLKLLAGAAHSATESRVRPFAKEMAQVVLQQMAPAKAPAKEKPATEAPAEKLAAAAAKAPAAPQPVAKMEEEKPADKPAAAPAEPPGYQRPANIREVYTRYNDLISATVMRDRAAVKELLDDGKSPNVRQKDGVTPLMVAASYGDADIAAMLLAKGADPNLRAEGARTALSMAKARGAASAQMVQLLQRSGAKD